MPNGHPMTREPIGADGLLPGKTGRSSPGVRNEPRGSTPQPEEGKAPR
jgi:hypothetical protein